MRIHATIDAQRNQQDVHVTLTPEDGLVTFNVPNVGRASACTFSVDAGQLQDVLTHLSSVDRRQQYDAAIDELRAEAGKRLEHQ